VTVLGSSGTYPGAGEACSGYLVRSPGATVAVDLGSGTLARLQEHVEVADLDAVVLTHEHPDHWLDLPVLRNAMRYVLGLAGLPVHGTAGTLAAALAVAGELGPTLVWSTIEAGSEVAVGDQRLRFSRTDHPVETLAVRVDTGGRSLLLSADTGPGWDPGPAGAGVDLFVCEATLRPEDEGRAQHLSARQAGALARSLGAGRLVVTHVAPGVDDAAQGRAAAEAFGGPVDVAADGATYAA
ncbi:MAG TPA: MBL fold metallo-hydrolase, partial [Acidimicrobiales bacterium]